MVLSVLCISAQRRALRLPTAPDPELFSRRPLSAQAQPNRILPEHPVRQSMMSHSPRVSICPAIIPGNVRDVADFPVCLYDTLQRLDGDSGFSA